ncbi:MULTISPECIES: fimbrial-like protein [Escherichia]|uniref:fimbrial-like protein n=1 Tax=Escherichia TaxID=561 RepID=UPI0002BA5B8D|nr:MULTISPECIES: fimbrial-like protein [Escherichia]MBY7620767.1 fimbrial protein [Escherichia marmotae]EFB2832506.1 fimbrial protein StaF [Escherichia coli]EFK3891425.1 fimbrial protein [Escherichia coli]EFO2099086.1 fimbrial protein StaF [Escherichia coli]EOQ55345.1 fimbrial-like adhesin protein [Escherichia coli KTE33]
MHPTQRNMMKKTGLFLSLILSTASPAIAGMDIDMTANVKNSTCQSGVSNLGNIDLGVVGVGYFSDNTSPEDYQPGGKEFTVTVTDCAFQETGDVLSQLHIDFRALNGVMAAGSQQIFANDNAAGATNVGVVIFSIQDPANKFNVLSSTGTSRSFYPVMTSAMNNSTWKFYARMQKINTSVPITSGQVTSNVLIDIYYE